MFAATKTKSAFMKKLFFALLCVCTLAGTALFTSCNKSVSPQTSQQQIEGKWTIQSAIGYYVMADTSRRDTTYFTASDYVQFNADGTLAIHDSVNDPGKTITGKWSIQNNKLLITESSYMDYPGGFDISTLTSSNLQLYYKQTDAYTTLEQKLNLTR